MKVKKCEFAHPVTQSLSSTVSTKKGMIWRANGAGTISADMSSY